MLQFCLSAILAAALLLTAAPWTPPRTPWGDPDLRGTYSNDNEYATPLERPAEFDGKRASDLTPAEMAEIRRQAYLVALNDDDWDVEIAIPVQGQFEELAPLPLAD